MSKYSHTFGGDWTSEKLEKVQKYLKAYATIMSKQPFKFAYIDAFAGTGYRKNRSSNCDDTLVIPELMETEPQSYLEGSARIALKSKPEFDKYIFIDKSDAHVRELGKLKKEFPDLEKKITLVQADANSYLQELCTDCSWGSRRALLFLDPYGMQVEWKTITAIAQTKAIDLFILFPAGIAVNRLLKKDGKISGSMCSAIDRIFGTSDWYDSFYKASRQETLFGCEERFQKTADIEGIGRFFIERLKRHFPGVAENPAYLRNSRGNPLFLLCFASANPKGAKTAVKIAKYILER